MLLEQVPIHKVPTVVTGDFNINLLRQDTPGKQNLETLMGSQGLVQHITEPTHRDGGLLDHVYTNKNVHVTSSGSVDWY
jgi:endonuclease/exonuclease/phosphatase family metal-dependent hydrolase